MNYFFGINNDIIKSKLTIPKFQNRSPNTNKDIKLFKCYPDNNEWKVEEIYKNIDIDLFDENVLTKNIDNKNEVSKIIDDINIKLEDKNMLDIDLFDENISKHSNTELLKLLRKKYI